ncbi:uncharacterized protein LOC134534987 isoform X2 [Bacillus rossius redtenbacheri]
MESSSKKATQDLDVVLQLNDALFTNFTPAKMLQGDNIPQLAAFITETLCKPQMYKKRLMVDILNSFLTSWEDDIAVHDLLVECATFLSTASLSRKELQPLRCEDGDSFCLFATALLNLCKDDRLKAEVSCNVAKTLSNYKESENKSWLIKRLWSEKDALGLPADVVEALVRERPALLEEPLVDAALAVARVSPEDCEGAVRAALAEPRLACLLRAAARSPRLFRAVTSVAHALLCRAPLNAGLLGLCRELAAAAAGRGGMARLLPPRLRALALLLQLDPELLPPGTLGRSGVLRAVAAALADDPPGASALLVYHPRWVQALSQAW